MTGKADFTEEEWELVREGPPTAGLVVLTASSGGSFRESWAMAKAFTEARKSRGASELLDELVGESPKVKRYHTPEEAEQEGLGRIRDAVALLEQKASPDEVDAYKRFTLDVADKVASAHREKGEIGDVSASEREAIDKITATLNS
jgi:ribosomal protein S12 methylthiotransferase accessory factor YcaO